MDQTKIGAFIAEMRRSQNLTQREFADRLGISNKTVSKWETGNGMPELSLMLPVCDILKINLNELFSGEKLNDAHYRIKAEENIMRLIEETEKMRKNIVGGDILGQTCDIKMDVCETHKINAAFWNTIGSTLLPYCRNGELICLLKKNFIYWEIYAIKKCLKSAAATAGL